MHLPQAEEACMRAGLVGGKFDGLGERLAELRGCEQLLPHLRRIVRRWDKADVTNSRCADRAERYARARGGSGPVAAAAVVALGRV